MSRPVSAYTVALNHALEKIKETAAQLHPDSEGLHYLQQDLYRSGPILATACNLFAELCEEFGIQDEEYDPKEGTQMDPGG